jgi:L-lactate dehydrogenase complex protein LldF
MTAPLDPIAEPTGSPLPSFQSAARVALADTQLRRNLGKATGTIRAKRAAVVGELSDWEALRASGAAIKADVMRHLDDYLLQLEAAVTQVGGQVHWARDDAEANAIIAALVKGAGATRVVKVKSLTTDEIGLNAALARSGVTAIETDLAELIIQLAGEHSSHILVPAIHKNRSEIRDLFRRTIARDRDLTDDPHQLAAAARGFLREQFLQAQVAISGANFAAADTGTVCVVESEGNGRMCLTLPRTLITVMGIEKVVPRFRDLEVFLQLLPRSSTGERMNPYTSLWTGVTSGDGPQAFHLILLDNGRTHVLADGVGRQALYCIRCSACLNICPVYARAGGHAYGSVYPGPIGAILTPQLVGIHRAETLPYASTLCGACYEVCPVCINIPEVLLHLRGQVARSTAPLDAEALAMRQLAWVLGNPARYQWAQRIGRRSQPALMRDGSITWLPGPLAGWTRARDLPPVARQTFREWWRRRKKGAG